MMSQEHRTGNKIRRSRRLLALAVAGLAFASCSQEPSTIGLRPTTTPAAPTTEAAIATPTTAAEVTTTPTVTTVVPPTTEVIAPTTTTTLDEFRGSCARFIVYAQNRWDPTGAAVRDAPDPLADKIGGFVGDEVIAVDGWVRSDGSPYPNIPLPYNQAIYFHVAYPVGGKEAWVSYAGVRGDVTMYDPQNQDGGEPAPLNGECLGTYTLQP